MRDIDKVIEKILDIQKKRVYGYKDYILLENFDHLRNKYYLELTNESGNCLCKGYHKEELFFVLHAIYDKGWMDEKIYSELYDIVEESTVDYSTPILMKKYLN